MSFCLCMVLTQIVRIHRTNSRTCQHIRMNLAVAQDHLEQRLQHVEGAQGLCSTTCKPHTSESFTTVKAPMDKLLAWVSLGQACIVATTNKHY